MMSESKDAIHPWNDVHRLTETQKDRLFAVGLDEVCRVTM
jgi:hypothetical protein